MAKQAGNDFFYYEWYSDIFTIDVDVLDTEQMAEIVQQG